MKLPTPCAWRAKNRNHDQLYEYFDGERCPVGWPHGEPLYASLLTDEMRGAIAYELTKRLVIDMPTARAAVDAALKP